MTKKAYAVSEKKLNRSAAYSPMSAGWTLYNPEKLAKHLDIDTDIVHDALEKTGFNKAVRIREELIRYKERLRKEQKALTNKRQVLMQEKAKVDQREREVREALENVRNILRIPREVCGSRNDPRDRAAGQTYIKYSDKLKSILSS
jgi:hypothetical protein